MSIVGRRGTHGPERPSGHRRAHRRLVALLAATVTALGLLVVTTGPASAATSIDAVNSFIQADPGPIVNVGSSVTVWVEARDSSGNAVTNRHLQLNAGSDFTVSPLQESDTTYSIELGTVVPRPDLHGVTDGSGQAFFTVTAIASGVAHLTVTDLDDGGTITPSNSQLTATSADSLRADSTMTASVLRVPGDGFSTSTIVVQLERGGAAVPSTAVTLLPTSHNPQVQRQDTPYPMRGTYGYGFYFQSTSVVIKNGSTVTNSAATNADGVAVFTVSDATPGQLVYFTAEVGTSAGVVEVADSQAVTFGDAPNNEATDSRVQLDNPQTDSSDNAPSETSAPADGTTSVSVYVQLSCDCSETSDWKYSYKDIPIGKSLMMPVPTVSDSSTRALAGAVAELVASTAGTHAKITAAYDAGSYDQSNAPLPAGAAYTGPFGEQLTDNNAVAIFTITDSVAEDVTLNAEDLTNNVSIAAPSGTTVNYPQSVTIHFLPTSPYQDHTTVTASPSGGVPADGNSTSKVTVTERDIQGNPISGRTVLLTANRTTAGISPTSATTGTDGVAKFSVTDTKAEKTTFTAVDQQAGYLGQTDVTFVPAAPSFLNSSISISPTTVPADGTSSATVTVSLEDASGNPSSGLPVTLSQGGGRSTVSPPTQTTDANGIATFTVTDTSVEVVYYQAAVTTGGPPLVLASLTPVTFTAGNVSAANSSVTADLTAVPADGSSASTVTITLRDAHNQPVAGKIVDLAGTGNAVLTPSGQQTTGSNGTAVYTVTDSTAEQVTLTGTDVTDSNIQVGSPLSVVFTGPPDPASSSVLVNPSSAAVNSIVTLKAIVRDANGNPVSGQHLFLNTAGAAYIVSTSPTSGVSGSDGLVTFLVSSSSPGVVVYNVLDQTTSSQLGSATVTFFGAPVGVHSTIAANPSQVPADGVTAATVTVTLHDINNNPVIGQLVNLTGNSAHTAINPSTPEQTDTSGVATFAVTDTQVEKVTYTATAGALTTNSVIVQFTQPGTEAGNSTVAATPSSGVPADGTHSSAVLVTLLDGNGSPLKGNTVTLSCPGGSATTTNAVSDANGEVAFSVTATTPGTVTCTAKDTSTGKTLQQTPQITFVVPPSEANRSTVVAAPTVVPNDGTTALITVTLTAADGSALVGHVVSLGQGSGGSTITPATATTGAGGVAAFQVSDHTAQAVTYTATDTTAGPAVTVDQHATVTFSDEKSASTAKAAPASVPADGHSASSIVVTLTAAGQPVVGHQVTLTPQNGASHVTVTTNPTGDDGKAVFQVTDTVGEVVTYAVQDSTLGLTLSAQPQVTFTADVPAPIVTSLSPRSGPAGQDVTIIGQNLSGAAVTFGSTPAGTVTINPAGTQVHATAPGGTGSVSVTVTTAGGSVSAGQFTYGAPSPVVTSMSTSYGPAGTAVTIVGTDLDSAAVTFGDAAASLGTDTATRIDLTAPAGSGVVAVVVHNAKGAVGAGNFTYTGGSKAPLIKTVSPTSGVAGATITFTGSRLAKPTAILFGSQPAIEVSTTASKLVVQAPAGTGSVPMLIATAKGATFAGTFGYTSSVQAPVITGLSPGSGKTGDTVTITGSHLDGAAVDFGGVPADIVSNVGSTLVVTVPSADGVSTVSVVTPGGRAAAGPFSALASPPKVTALSPKKAAVGAQVTLTGTNLDGATVKFGAHPATVVSDSASSIVVTVPAGSGKVAVLVTTAGGSANAPGKFTYK